MAQHFVSEKKQKRKKPLDNGTITAIRFYGAELKRTGRIMLQEKNAKAVRLPFEAKQR